MMDHKKKETVARQQVAIFLDAAVRGSVVELRKLLSRGVQVDVRDTKGNTALMLAAANGRLDVVKSLVEVGANVDEARYDEENFFQGFDALTLAVQEGHPAIVDFLLKHGNYHNGSANAASYALRNIDLILNRAIHFASSGNEPLKTGPVVMKSAEWRRLAVSIRLLLKAGADVNTDVVAASEWESDTTALMVFLHYYNQSAQEIVFQLIRSGADPNAADSRHRSSLTVALCSEAREVYTKILLEYGANPNQPDEDGNTPLMEAARRCSPETVSAHISSGAEVNLQDNNGKTAIAHAVSHGSGTNGVSVVRSIG